MGRCPLCAGRPHRRQFPLPGLFVRCIAYRRAGHPGLKTLGENKKEGQFLCGFSMETQNMLENSRAKLEKKKIDMIAANNLKEQGAGFNTDTNVITLITKDEEKQLPKMTKEEVADALLDFIVSKN